MKQTLSTDEAASILVADENGGWSYSGARALVEYLEEIEDETGEEMELDIVAVRCDYSEHTSLWDWAENYFGGDAYVREEFGIEYTDSDGVEYEQSTHDEDGDIHDEVLDSIAEYIRDNGTLIEFDGGIIVSSF